MRAPWYPGYSVAAVSTVAVVLSAPGQTLLVSLLNVPLRTTFQIDPLTLNAAYMAATVAASLPLVWIGGLTDKLGPRKMLALVACAFGAACLFTSAVAHLAMVLVAFFLLRFLGQGSLTLVASHALAMWFDRRLGTITGVRAVVLFAVWAPLPALTLWLIGALGWRLTWAVFGIVIAATLSLLSWLFVRDRPEELGLSIDGRVEADADAPKPDRPELRLSLAQAKRTPAYWVLAIAGALPPMVGTAVLFDIQPLFALRGLDAEAAARTISVWSITMAVMALPSGRMVDRWRPAPLLAAGTFGICLASALLFVARSEAVAMAAFASAAAGQSLVTTTVGTTAARFFGREHHGAIRSSIARIGVIATGVGPLVFGVSQRLAGGFDPALIGFAALCLPMVVATLWLRSPQGHGASAP